MLGWLVFMRGQIDNTATEDGERLPPALHSRLRGEHAPIGDVRALTAMAGRVTTANPWGTVFTVRFWDYSRKPSNRIVRNPLKTLDTKFSTREKFRFSGFHFPSLLTPDVTAARACTLQRPPVRSNRFLSRYTCRDRKRLFSCGINNITKTKSIHFRYVWNT